RHTSKTSGYDFAIGSLRDDFLKPAPAGPKAHAHRRHQKTGTALLDANNLASQGRSASKWLLAKDVLAGTQRSDGLLRMERRGSAEIHQLDVGVSQKVLQLFINFDLGAQVYVFHLLNISGDALQDAVDRQSYSIANGGDARRRIELIGTKMKNAHETHA